MSPSSGGFQAHLHPLAQIQSHHVSQSSAPCLSGLGVEVGVRLSWALFYHKIKRYTIGEIEKIIYLSRFVSHKKCPISRPQQYICCKKINIHVYFAPIVCGPYLLLVAGSSDSSLPDPHSQGTGHYFLEGVRGGQFFWARIAQPPSPSKNNCPSLTDNDRGQISLKPNGGRLSYTRPLWLWAVLEI